MEIKLIAYCMITSQNICFRCFCILQTGSCHDDRIIVTGDTGGCHDNNLHLLLDQITINCNISKSEFIFVSERDPMQIFHEVV